MQFLETNTVNGIVIDYWQGDETKPCPVCGGATRVSGRKVYRWFGKPVDGLPRETVVGCFLFDCRACKKKSFTCGSNRHLKRLLGIGLREWILANPTLSNSELARQSGISRETIRRNRNG